MNISLFGVVYVLKQKIWQIEIKKISFVCLVGQILYLIKLPVSLSFIIFIFIFYGNFKQTLELMKNDINDTKVSKEILFQWFLEKMLNSFNTEESALVRYENLRKDSERSHIKIYNTYAYYYPLDSYFLKIESRIYLKALKRKFRK